MAETTANIRVVPSGKIYRQLFDAQVQLNRSLTKIHRDSSAPQPRFQKRGVTSVPLVHLSKEEIKHGLLGERQRTWVDGFPNDPYVENPVVYKQYAEYINTKLRESDSSIAGKDVQGLPDVVLPAKDSSDIIERIASSRKERHEAAVEEMHQELSVINSEMEPHITETSEMLLRKLDDDNKDIADKLACIEKDEKLLSYTLEELNNIWEDVLSHTPTRQVWITELDTALGKAEDERMDMIRAVFKNFAKTLERIAHLLAPDLHRFLDKESQLINQTMLSNRRAFADLYTKLMSADIEREKSQHTTWKRRVEDWRLLKTELAVKRFKEFMQGEDIVNPSGVAKLLQVMTAEQRTQNQKRLELINQMREFKPPASTKTAIYNWNKNMQDLSQEIDAVNQIHLTALHKEYERVCQRCLSEIETIKTNLIDASVCTIARAQTVVEEFMIPLVGSRQRVYENILEMMEKTLEEQTNEINEKLKSLFKYAQSAAHVWDVHEIGLARQERSLQEKLEQCRQKHDNQNQEKEANLDVIMDRMRQDATESALKTSLNKALDYLEKIRASYENFHKDQTEIVKKYPSMVQHELESYETSVLKFFMVDRNLAKDLQTAVTEILSTQKGTTFYVLVEAGEHLAQEKSREKSKVGKSQPEGGAFMTEVDPGEEEKPDYITSIDIDNDLLSEIKKLIRLNFLNHMEEWMEQASDRSMSVVVAKCEELNSELDLRLHLHKPRARRAEYDVHNVRAAELVMHSERVTRHCKGVLQALTEVRQRFQNMTQEHNDLAAKFRQNIESLEIVFMNATKSSKLIALQHQLSVELDKFMSIIRASLRHFRQNLDETLQMLRESNARFIKSFKLFSDGGNFCPEEIDDYKKKLEKMSQKIDAAEGSIMSDLEGMESKRLDQATKVAIEFEDKFKNHMVDLIFMEKIARLLTNTQVKIKAEVASSNSQAQQLAQHLSDLDCRIDACERPNLDKEEKMDVHTQITSSQLNMTLQAIFDAFHNRSKYLDCLKQPPALSTAPSSMTNPILGGARVGFVSDATPTPVSKAGKQPMEDPSVGVIKNILKSQKSKLRFGSDADLDGEYPSRNAASDIRDKMKSSVSTHTSSDKGKVSKRGMSPISDSPKKSYSAATKRSNRPAKNERRVLIFGDSYNENEEAEGKLLATIRKMLKEILDLLLKTAEKYYVHKGNRAVTRPQALQETYEHFADVVAQKLQSYYTQADEYHNQCLQEFRKQLIHLEQSISRVPGLVINDLLKEHIQMSLEAQQKLQYEFSTVKIELEKKQDEHKQQLRPTLGHPHQVEQLKALCQQETERHGEFVRVVEKYAKNQQDTAVEHAKDFMSSLLEVSKSQLGQYDKVLVVDDVEKGRVEPTKYPTSELIRRKNAGEPLEDDEDKDAVPRGQSTWPGIPANELVVGPVPSKVQLTPSVTTFKTTLGHSATTAARDKSYQDYKKQFEGTLQMIEEEKQRLLVAEQRWLDSWNTSVQKVKDLY
ncbi:hypothetical protein CHS0354_024214 [Potamilus streckersoni]|uniref:DUF4455 domain-containing protein n=1 Tax=Potamilus streckersoni TaxID=2493646 RepID=A0AAE0RY68_9BIVA|nr:hypothetical protein CHS0354_024214 [Potamilus streckersoni]